MANPPFERVLSAVILVVLGMVVGSTRFALTQEATQPESVWSGSNQFAFDLFNKIASPRKDTNLFFSPTSISMALGMVYAGSGGETLAQMAVVVQWLAEPQ